MGVNWKTGTKLVIGVALVIWSIGTSESLEGFVHTHKHERAAGVPKKFRWCASLALCAETGAKAGGFCFAAG